MTTNKETPEEMLLNGILDALADFYSRELNKFDYRDIIPSELHGTLAGDLLNGILEALSKHYYLVEKGEVNE